MNRVTDYQHGAYRSGLCLHRAHIAIFLTLILILDASKFLLFIVPALAIYGLLNEFNISIVIVKSDPKVDAPEPETIDIPKPVSKVDIRKPSLEIDIPKPSLEIDISESESEVDNITNSVLEADILKSDPRVDIPKPVLKADTRKPSLEVDIPKSILEINLPEFDSKVDTPKPALKVDIRKPSLEVDIPKPDLNINLSKPTLNINFPNLVLHVKTPTPVLKTNISDLVINVDTPIPVTIVPNPVLNINIPKRVLKTNVRNPILNIDSPKSGIETDVSIPMSNMETKAIELPTVLKNSNLSIDVKLSHLKSIKSDIKQSNVPEGAVSPIFESLRLALSSQHPALQGAAFSTLGHFLKRLYIQEQEDLVSAYTRSLCPSLLHHLGDHKERVRSQAAEAFTELWKASHSEVEHHVLRVALVGKNPRAREMSMIWLANMAKTHGILFRAYVPSLVACLEDSDSGVRDTAKTTVIQLFQNASAVAKSDLKKQLAANNVRKSITSMILTSLGLGSSDQEPSISRPVSRVENVHTRPASRVESARPISAMSSRSQHHSEVSKEDPEPDHGPVPTRSRPAVPKTEPNWPVVAENDGTREESSKNEDLEPLDVSTGKEFEEIVNDMLPLLDDKETEYNWQSQRQLIVKLRRLTRGNAPHEFPHEYLTTLKILPDRIVKAVTSVRTKMSNSGCYLVSDIAKACGPRMDSMVETLMQNLLRVCNQTNKVVVQPASAAVTVVLENVSFTRGNQNHVLEAYKHKNYYVRLQAARWLQILINKPARHRSAEDLDSIANCIENGIKDASPDVRECMRGTFWTFNGVYPEKSNEILVNLDSKQRSYLEKHPANPNKGQAKPSSQKTPAKGTSISALKAAIAAHKKVNKHPAAALPPRPESAQSAFPEVKTSDAPLKSYNESPKPPDEPSKLSSAPPPKPSAVRNMAARPHISSLSSAPVRPAMKPRRPELARPATAEPYATRKPAATESHTKPATQPRTDSPRVDTTKSKPKKLDIKKTRVHGSDEQNTPPTIQGPTMDMGDSIPNSNVDLNGATKASDPVTIYEDPVPGASPHIERDDATIAPDDYPSRAANLPATITVPESAADGLAQHPVSGIDHVPELHPTDSEMHPALSASGVQGSLKASERSYSPDSMVIQNPAVVSESASIVQGPMSSYTPPMAQSPAGQTDTRSNENTTLEHAHPASPEQRAAPKYNEDTAAEHAHPASEQRAVPEYNENIAVEHVHPASPEQQAFPKSDKTTSVEHAHPVSSERVAHKSNILHTTEPAHRDNKRPPQTKSQKDKGQTNSNRSTEREDDITRRSWRSLEAAQLRWSISPLSKDPENARQMVKKSIDRLRTNKMDVLAFRKLQGVIQFHDQMFTDEELFDQLLIALFEYLERPTTEKRGFLDREGDLKVQAVFTLRFMFKYNKKYFTAYYPRAMTAFVTAVKHLPLGSAVPGGLKDMAEDIAGECTEIGASDVVDAVLDLIITEERDERGYRSINMGVFVISAFLSPFLEDTRLPSSLLDRVGGFAGKCLSDSRQDTRRQVIVLCKQLHSMVTEGRFWDMLGFIPVHSRSLLAYYAERW